MSQLAYQALEFVRGGGERVWCCRGSRSKIDRGRFRWGKCCVLAWGGRSGRIARRESSHSLEVRLVRVDLMGSRASLKVGSHRCSWLINGTRRERHVQLRWRDRVLVPLEIFLVGFGDMWVMRFWVLIRRIASSLRISLLDSPQIGQIGRMMELAPEEILYLMSRSMHSSYCSLLAMGMAEVVPL